ncbi:tetratricopeptide (TPR) repeat protein [Agrococcus sp. BE272]|nr:tetratricopeptide (TPR) repeat protein [Agrococcus sp. BE272]
MAEDLDIGARAQLKTLTKDNAEFVAKHMAMASRLIDENPELAHEHALTAARRAGRIGVVRETLAITAYQLGDFALALRELRTYRRITGRDDQLPLMADCERGLGRPEKALELARSVDAATLETPVRVELAIVKSGARLDLGQPEAALEELRIPELRRDKAFEYSPALFASYAGVLEELGRDDEAAEWFALADRAIDALEAALAPGELESIAITTERIEDDGEATAEESGVPLEADVDDAAEAGDDDDEAAEEADEAADEHVEDVHDVEGAAEPEQVEPPAEPVQPGAAAAAVDEAEPASEEPAPHGDALFGDALFGDDLIEDEDEDEDQEPGRGGDAR